MAPPTSHELDALKEELLTMASYAELAVSLAVKAVFERDDQLAGRVTTEDRILDGYEVRLDERAIRLLSSESLPAAEVRRTAVTMKISQNLERVGDEATTIARRALALNRDAPLRVSADLQELAALALGMLKEALDAFVHGREEQARAVIGRDQEADAIHKQFQQELTDLMTKKPETVRRGLDLMVISKSLERIADHATNIAEEAVYLHAGRDIRHGGKEKPATSVPSS